MSAAPRRTERLSAATDLDRGFSRQATKTGLDGQRGGEPHGISIGHRRGAPPPSRNIGTNYE